MKQDITIETKALTLADQSNRFPRIRGHKHLEVANQLMKAATTMIKEIQGVFKPMKQKTHAAHKAVLEEEGKLVEPIIIGVSKIKTRIKDYLVEQDRLRREAEKKEELRLMQERLGAKGKEEKAQQVQEQLDEIPTTKPAVAYVPPKLEGTHTREDWDYEIESPSKFFQGADICFFLPNHFEIRKTVKAQKGSTKIPGVRIFSKTVIVNR